MDARHDSQSTLAPRYWNSGARSSLPRETRSLPGYGQRSDFGIGTAAAHSREPMGALDAASGLDPIQSIRLGHDYMTYANQAFAVSTPAVVEQSNHDAQSSSRLPSGSHTLTVDMDDRSPERPPKLPPVHDFSLDGILEAIQPEIQTTIDEIAEILGRSRYSLANEYGAHMPPQGEIRASRTPVDQNLLPVEEASSSNERLASDPVVILGEDTSLIDGSHAGSVAYELLGRIRAAARRQGADSRDSGRQDRDIIPNITQTVGPPFQPPTDPSLPRMPHANHLALLQSNGTRRIDQPATITTSSPAAAPIASPLTVHESSRHFFPLHDFEHTDLLLGGRGGGNGPVESRIHSLAMIRDLQSLMSWLYQSAEPQRPTTTVSASSLPERASDRLRGILDRHDHAAAAEQSLDQLQQQQDPQHHTDPERVAALYAAD